MRKVIVSEFVDNQKFSRFHFALLISCIFIIIVDGYDMFMLGAIMPTLMEEWKMDAVAGGQLGSYALFGMMIGALVFGPVADRFGRKNVILICTILFSLFTFTSGFANGPNSFGIQRFIAGVGLGGVMPNLIALVTEYAPAKLRSTLVAIMFSGHAFGGIVASLGALAILPSFGWRGVVFLACLPLLLLPLLYKVMPESYSYYIKVNKQEQLVRTLNRINPDFQFEKSDQLVMHESDDTDSSLRKLFTEKRGFSTVMFWVAAFMCLLVMYGLSTWLPKIMQSAGYPIGSSLIFLIVLNLGGVTGAIFAGKLCDKFGSRRILLVFFALGFVSLTALSFSPSQVLLYIMIFIAGATTTGTQINTNAYVSQYYPSGIRSTGVGWELGIGRIGGMLGPVIGGFLLSSNLPIHFNFLAFAIPCLIAGLAILLVQEKYGHLVAPEEHDEVQADHAAIH
ncbi:MFS transporter [Lysinibacillus yapensis]|uniref:MFS transporter n=1 Tax=Ureibacillus yapensis TaxID=2304605 RepID=A0A396S6K6_9BACL|nr:aromatic acid/H+ symport family MFS transporter [Lysinibacillus yapensis]RHW36123.1 MFS transporter [Lysinibacillus yapensis]